MLTSKLSLTINSFLITHTYNKDDNFPFKELFKEYGENIKIKYSMLVFCKGIENKKTNSYDKRYVLVDANNNYKEYIESEDKYYFMYEDKKEYSYLYDSQEKLTIEGNKIKIESKENILTFVKMKKYNCYILLQIEDKKSKEKITINYDITNQYIQNIQDDKGNEYTFNYNDNQRLKTITFNDRKKQNYYYENNMLSSISYEDKKMQFNYKNNQFIYNDSNCECKNVYTIIHDNNLHILKDNQEYLKASLEDNGKLFKVINEGNKARHYLLDTKKEKVINQYV